MVDINDVSKLYGNTVKAGNATKPLETPNVSFGDVLKNSIDDAVQAQKTSEQMSARAVTGNADVTDVLQAVTDAEIALNTVLSVRDRVINAYQSIMRTPI